MTRNGQNKLRLSHVTCHVSVTSSRFPLYRDGIQIWDVDGRYDMLCLRLCVDVGQLPHAAQSFPSVSGQLSSWGTTGPSHLNLDPSHQDSLHPQQDVVPIPWILERTHWIARSNRYEDIRERLLSRTIRLTLLYPTQPPRWTRRRNHVQGSVVSSGVS